MALEQDDAIAELAQFVQKGLDVESSEPARTLLQNLFKKGRYHARHERDITYRNPYGLQSEDDKGVPFAGMINANNPSSGRYGGASVVWFPTKEHGSLIGLGVGSQGISPDESILTRHGHRRRVRSLRAHLGELGVACWSKSDPAALDSSIPESLQKQFANHEHALKRYANEMYCIAELRADMPAATARKVVQAFLDLFAIERGWNVLAAYQKEFDAFRDNLESRYFQHPSADKIYDVLQRRRFVVLQGPPGTGKTRFTEELSKKHFGGNSMTVQFHPSVTYEDFVVGLSPEPSEHGLHFNVKPGWLSKAVFAAQERPFLLVIDEINRADLGRVLGEAVYLFEADEVGKVDARAVELTHEVNGNKRLRLPANLFVVATMNTADRSIARMDLAIRRRFAFVTVPPDPAPVDACGIPLAKEAFSRIQQVFVEHGTDEVLDLMPGHAYFLAANDADLRVRMRYSLLPLLGEYLQLGLMGSAHADLETVRDWLEDELAGKA